MVRGSVEICGLTDLGAEYGQRSKTSKACPCATILARVKCGGRLIIYYVVAPDVRDLGVSFFAAPTKVICLLCFVLSYLALICVLRGVQIVTSYNAAVSWHPENRSPNLS